MSEQRCGTCKWWRLWPNSSLVYATGDCFWYPNVVSDAMRLNIEREPMMASEGTNCPCYEKRENEEMDHGTAD